MLLVTTMVPAQAVQIPPRDRPSGPPPQPAGTGAIKGRVVDAQTGSAVARAHVRLNWMGPAIPRPPVTTDDSGAFVFTALPAGSFMLMVDKSTYLMGRYPEPGQTVRTSNRPLTLADGQVLDNLTVRLYHGAAITGRVVDAHGDPLEFAQVQALRLPKSGRGTAQPRNGTNTNDLGEFRLARLEPGKYLVFVMPQRREMFFGPGAPPPDQAELQPVPTYYPGVPAIDQAQPITVERAMTVNGIEIPVVDGVTSQVAGMVIDASGAPVRRGGGISVRTIVKDVAGGFTNFGSPVRPDGTFQLRLPPGEYELEARVMPAGIGGPPAPGSEQFGLARITVAGDVTGLAIQLGSGASVSGRVVFDGTSPVPRVPNNRNVMGLAAFMPADGAFCRGGQPELAPDWTFRIEGVFGTCTARVNGGFDRWLVKSMSHNGKDLLNQPVTFTPGQQLRDVEVVMTDKRTELNFHVTDGQGTPTRDYVGLVFSVDKTHWTDTTGRYVRTLYVPPVPPGGASFSTASGGAGANVTLVGGVTGGVVGGFAGGPSGVATSTNAPVIRREMISGVPPGEYYVLAVDDLESETARDPEFLEELSLMATRVTLAEGIAADVNLRRHKLSPR